MTEKYDVVVIGAGHAGCEAAHAAAKLGCSVLLTTLSKNNIGFMPCNPSIGGTGKGHLVREIDALGGIMGIAADKSALQVRLLNEGKGAAVASLRAQIDKEKYHNEIIKILEAVPLITIKECEVTGILYSGTVIRGVKTADCEIACKAVIAATGVYLNSATFTGDTVRHEGPSGFPNANFLTQALINMGVEIRRFKTGTPARIDIASIDFTKTTPQRGDDGIRPFSFMSREPIKNVILCHLTYTNPAAHQIIRDNIKKSAQYGGLITGIGPRYCPSIEDKVMRFADRDRHQVFLEPETANGREIYLQGVSSSLPSDIQAQFIRTMNGLEHADIIRSGYAIEYDCINPLELSPTLAHKRFKGLYFAGQINGTSGYEEAAAQGLLAGINCARYLNGKDSVTLSRTSSYIGVLVDDLTTLGTNEPYRMFTARAEHRLILRQDNADERLTPLGHEIGTVDGARWEEFTNKQETLKRLRQALDTFIPQKKVAGIFNALYPAMHASGMTVKEILRRPEITLTDIVPYLDFFRNIPPEILEQVTTEVKYEGYIRREQSAIAETKRREATALPPDFDYSAVSGLRKESQIKLNTIKPASIGQAMRISGVTPADITVLLICLRKMP